MNLRDTLWGGGSIEATSPEASSPIPPSDEEMRAFFDSARQKLRESRASEIARNLEHAEHIKDIVFGGPLVRFILERDTPEQLTIQFDE